MLRNYLNTSFLIIVLMSIPLLNWAESTENDRHSSWSVFDVISNHIPDYGSEYQAKMKNLSGSEIAVVLNANLFGGNMDACSAKERDIQVAPIIYSCHMLNGNYLAASELFSDSNMDFQVHKAIANYLGRYEVEDLPLQAHFNGSLAYFIEKELTQDSLVIEAWRSIGIKAICRIILHGGQENSMWFELLGDLIMNLNTQRDNQYLASFAYQRALENSDDENVREAYKMKAVFAMEEKVIHPEYYNRVRYFELKKAFDAEQLISTEFRESIENVNWSDVDMMAEATALFQWIQGEANLQLWSGDETSPALTFVNEQVQFDSRSQTGFNPNDDITNPNIDPGEIKQNVIYNFYAIVVLLTLFATVGTMWYKLRKASRILTEKETKMESVENNGRG